MAQIETLEKFFCETAFCLTKEKKIYNISSLMRIKISEFFILGLIEPGRREQITLDKIHYK